MNWFHIIPLVLIFGTHANAIPVEKCKDGIKCFCMPTLGGEKVCVETKKTQEEIKAAMLSSL